MGETMDDLHFEAMLLALNAEIDARNLADGKIEKRRSDEMLSGILKNQSVIMRLLLKSETLENKIEKLHFDEHQDRWVTG